MSERPGSRPPSANTLTPEERELYTVQVSISPAADLIQVEKCRLVVVDGPDRGRELVLTKPIVRIGANEKNDLALNDNTVSRFHCEIRQVGDEYLLVDRQSTNGTYVGKLRVREAFLYANCEILVGNSLIRFVPLVEEVAILPIEGSRYGDLIGAAPRMKEIYGLIDKIGPSELSVVIEGETGTGKELVSRALHERSRRADGPLVIFDCSAFPENLLESELFGHEKGAFSGAIRTHRGVFERAEGGTIFFDELGEMGVALQPKFLRALESGEIRRVGGERPIKVDVRVVAATNRDLAQMVDEGSFRRDLFYRLAKVRLRLPPLRDRVGDLPLLIEHFLADLRERQPGIITALGFTPDALELMQAYDWPGNIRELRNVVERAATFADGDLVDVADLPTELQARLGRPARAAAAGGQLVADIDPGTGLKEAKEKIIEQFERDYLVSLLERHEMNISKVAREAGIDRRHVYRLMKKYDIVLPERLG
ncbi:MAG: sigma 54-interacting transcriptional regulator [Myxococcales bacterium]|nr:sigma 54-interacting transcriptional regulator [Myxococcales bacterium]MCB9553994.1 sigma 54-interacting transcriptional regulator [Myxococcales bacterium]